MDKLSHLIDLFDYLPLANRNYIVDGNFEQWINTSLAITALSNSIAVMYYNDPSTSGQATVSQNSFAIGAEPAGMTSPVQYYMKHNQTTLSSGTPSISQRIEDVRTLAGRSLTFSLWLWCDSGTVTIPSVLIGQNFGTGGSASAQANTTVNVGWNVTTTPQKFSVRIDLPSISGKTIGTNANSYLNTILYLPSGSTFAVNTTQWQLEQCSPQAPLAGQPTAFEYRGKAVELARVQRFFEVGIAGASFASFTTANSYSSLMSPVTWHTTKRAAPTVSFSNVMYYSGGTPTSLASGNYSAVNISADGGSLYLTAGMTNSGGLQTANYAADCRL